MIRCIAYGHDGIGIMAYDISNVNIILLIFLESLKAQTSICLVSRYLTFVY